MMAPKNAILNLPLLGFLCWSLAGPAHARRGTQPAAPEPAPAAAASRPRPLKTLPADDFLLRLEDWAKPLRTAPTTVLKEETLQLVKSRAQALLQVRWLEAVVVVEDVRMKNSETARLTVHLHLPKFDRLADRTLSIVRCGPVDLAMTQEKARTLLPGRKIAIRGPARYTGTYLPLAVLPVWSEALARISFGSGTSAAAVLSLSPQEYKPVR